MKLIRVFMVFVVVSLFFGISSAFNGQTVSDNKEGEDLSTEAVENTIASEIDVDNEESLEIEEASSGDDKLNVSFSESNIKSSNNSKTETKQSTTNNSTTQSNSNSNNTQTTTPQTANENTNVNETNSNDTKSNDLMYSVTKGNPEYSTLDSCDKMGFTIKNNELDYILDWNEKHPDDKKQATIKSSWCIEVMKDDKIYYYLHFITENGENLDNKLKELYK